MYIYRRTPFTLHTRGHAGGGYIHDQPEPCAVGGQEHDGRAGTCRAGTEGPTYVDWVSWLMWFSKSIGSQG